MAWESLRGESVVVTGAASGIGRAAALRFAACGARVWVADLDEVGGRETCRRIEELGVESRWVGFDLTREASIEAAAEAIQAHWGAPDVLVNAAGWDELIPFVESELDFIERVVALNLIGPLKLTRALLPGTSRASPRRCAAP